MTATTYRPTIGLEVHVQLATRTKLFCRCEARFGAPPNTLVCPVCTGQPGTLPMLNAEALRLGVIGALVLGCRVDEQLHFDRKNYFYPDLPKGYQITQWERPLAQDGQIVLDRPEGELRVTIARAHLEEDAGKVIHPEGMDVSLLDLNRAGTPLLEIVTAPELHSADEAHDLLVELRRMLRYAGVSDCDMEKGGLRCDVNVSLSASDDEALGTRTEIKNLNSFRFVAAAIAAETARQRELIEAGGRVVQATLAYDPDTDSVRALRLKQDAHDYRYFPEPDLPPFPLAAEWVLELREGLPESPTARSARYGEQLKLPPAEVETLVADKALGDYFEATLAAVEQRELAVSAHGVAAWVVNGVRHLANERKTRVTELAVSPTRLAELLALVHTGSVSSQAGKRILDALEQDGERTAEELVAELGLQQMSDPEDLAQLVSDVLQREPELVARYCEGKSGVLNALLGRAMEASGGRANPNRVRSLLEHTLDATSAPQD